MIVLKLLCIAVNDEQHYTGHYVRIIENKMPVIKQLIMQAIIQTMQDLQVIM